RRPGGGQPDANRACFLRRIDADLHAQCTRPGNWRGLGSPSRREAHSRRRLRRRLLWFPTRRADAFQPDFRCPTMIIQIVQFRLAGISRAQYLEHAEQVAPRFPQMPGFVSKVWLANADTNTYGGLYTWRDRAALEQYRASEIYRRQISDPHFVDLS